MDEENRKLTNDEAADYLGVARATLSTWRCTKRYPLPYIKLGRKVCYLKSDLDRFVQSRRVNVEEAEGGR